MSKLKVSPSLIKTAGRCKKASALSRTIDPQVGRRFKPQFGESTKAKMAAGIHFEVILTGKEFVPREKSDRKYESWCASSSTAGTRARVEAYAEMCKKYFGLSDPHESGIWLEYEFPDFILNGEADFFGRYRTVKPVGFEWMIGWVDIKLTENIVKMWDMGGQSPMEQFLQPSVYSFIHSMSSSKNPEVFLMAISARKRGEDPTPFIREWEATNTIYPSAFFICEKTDTGFKRNKEGDKTLNPPYTRMVSIENSAMGFLDLYFQIYDMVSETLTVMSYGNVYHPDVRKIIQPSQYRCLGIGKRGETKGICPFMPHCMYGREVISGEDTVSLENLLTLE